MSENHNMKDLFEDYIKKLNSIRKKPENSKDWNYIMDGVFDWGTYFEQEIKILFVLKEANSGGDETAGFSIPEAFMENPEKNMPNQTWYDIALWARGLLNIDKEYSYNELNFMYNDKTSEKDNMIDILKKIAFINLKKVGGAGSSDEKTLEFLKNKDFKKITSEILTEQIEILKPNFIICCGKVINEEVGDFLVEIMSDELNKKEVKWEHTKRGVYFLNCEKFIIIQHDHPQSRIKREYKYYSLMDAFRELSYKDEHRLT